MSAPNSLILEDRGVFALSGADMRPFLQGIITNNIDRLEPGSPLYAAILTPQGKFLFDFFLIDTGMHILMDCQGARRDALFKRLRMYRLRAAVEIEDVTQAHAVAVVWGGDTATTEEVVSFPDPRLAALGKRLVGPPDSVAAALTGTTPASLEDWTAHRIGLGVPESGVDILPEDTFWLEANAEELNGVDFKKGCYVGQEVTSRIKHKSSLKKRLIPLDFGDHLAPADVPVMAGDKKAGDVRSTAGGRAIAMLRIDRVAKAEGRITAGDLPARLDPPDWMDIPHD